MKRVRCPKCDNYITFDETKYPTGQSLVFQCNECGKEFGIRIGVSKLRSTQKEESKELDALTSSLRPHPSSLRPPLDPQVALHLQVKEPSARPSGRFAPSGQRPLTSSSSHLAIPCSSVLRTLSNGRCRRLKSWFILRLIPCRCWRIDW